MNLLQNIQRIKSSIRGAGGKTVDFGGFRHEKNPQKIFKSVLKILSKKLPRNAFLPLTRRRAVTTRGPKISPILFRNRSPSRSSSCFFASLLFEKPSILRPKTQYFWFLSLLGRYVLPTFFFLKALRLTLTRPFLCLVRKGKPEKDKKFFIPYFPLGNPFSQRICGRLAASCPTPEN